MTERVLREDREGLCTLTLNRPDKLNALDTATFEELDAHCATLERQTDSIGCVLVKANGRAFCAGADIGGIGAGFTDSRFKLGVIARLAKLPQPVIAAVHGVCFTGGLELALAADVIIAARSARFADTHGKWGLVGAWGMTQRLPRRIGISQAKRLMFGAQPIDAEEAARLGLVDMLVDDDALEKDARAFAGQALANSWHTNVETKKLLAATEGMSLADGLAYEFENYPASRPTMRNGWRASAGSEVEGRLPLLGKAGPSTRDSPAPAWTLAVLFPGAVLDLDAEVRDDLAHPEDIEQHLAPLDAPAKLDFLGRARFGIGHSRFQQGTGDDEHAVAVTDDHVARFDQHAIDDHRDVDSRGPALLRMLWRYSRRPDRIAQLSDRIEIAAGAMHDGAGEPLLLGKAAGNVAPQRALMATAVSKHQHICGFGRVQRGVNGKIVPRKVPRGNRRPTDFLARRDRHHGRAHQAHPASDFAQAFVKIGDAE